MDIGAGSGYFSKMLLKKTQCEEAWCIDINYEKNIDSIENGKPIHFLKSVDVDTVLFMDVLEHVDDDVGLLRHYMEKNFQSGQKLL